MDVITKVEERFTVIDDEVVWHGHESAWEDRYMG